MNALATDNPATAEFEKLRGLLVGPEQNELEALQQRIQSLESQLTGIQERAAFFSEALPECLDMSGNPDSRLHRSLMPKVDQVVHTSVRSDPNILAEALYPIMGPIIRKTVHKLFESGKRSQWSPYNVEQLFVIHRISGLVISHESAPGIAYHDADMVSGMLDAVRSFVQEAFDSHEFDGLRLMTVGDVNVRIEWSPHVVLAAVVRGVEPDSLRPALEATLSDIHARYETQLDSFNGDSSPFEAISPMLNGVLAKTAPSRLSHFWRNYRPFVAIATTLIVLTGIVWMIYESSKWNQLLDELAREPGIVVVNQEQGLGHKKLQVLQDPYARNIDAIIERHEYQANSIELSASTFYSDDAIIRLKRATASLSPPAGTDIYLNERTLHVVGEPGDAWFERAEKLVPFIQGIQVIERAADASQEWTSLP